MPCPSGGSSLTQDAVDVIAIRTGCQDWQYRPILLLETTAKHQVRFLIRLAGHGK